MRGNPNKLMAKLAVDAGIASGFDYSNPVHGKFPYGIPTTRAEFDFHYRECERQGIKAEDDYIRSFTKPASTLVSELAKAKAAFSKERLPYIADELTKRKINPAPWLGATLQEMTGPADISIPKLDPGLTRQEKDFVIASRRIARFILKHDLLVSRKSDAPEGSDWRKRIQKESKPKASGRS